MTIKFLKVLYRWLRGRCINCGGELVQGSPDNDDICLECYMNIMIHGETEKGVIK